MYVHTGHAFTPGLFRNALVVSKSPRAVRHQVDVRPVMVIARHLRRAHHAMGRNRKQIVNRRGVHEVLDQLGHVEAIDAVHRPLK